MINKANIDLLFEVSWEVCNKIGGIYTVLSTKAKTLQKLYKDKVVFVGPDVWTDNNPSPYFIETKTPIDSWIKNISLPSDITVRCGRWNVPGKPIVILIGFEGMYQYNNELYGKLWERFGVDSLNAYGDYPEACAFSHACATVIESLCRLKKNESKQTVVHCDEWTTGATLLILKDRMPSIATIFTTHATSIGRSICGNGKPLYDYLRNYNGDQMAHELNMVAKHTLEKAAAHNADCFTTVSEITAVECEQLLDIRPAVVTPNGFEDNFVPAKIRFASERAEARKKLLDVASHLTGQKYSEKTSLIATSGRCEYRNKGIDMFIDSALSLATLNPDNKVIAFILVPAWSKEARMDLVDSDGSHALAEPYLTHWLNNPDQDPILRSIRWHNVTNNSSSNVDIIYVPCYLNGNDGIFNEQYYKLLIGFDATVFPSYYEPWGYTPLESVAFGIPTITTSLSGFGQFILSSLESSFTGSGVVVVPRSDSNYSFAVDNIARCLYTLLQCTSAERNKISGAARATAAKAAWDYFIEYYIESFEIALHKAAERTNNK